MSNTTSTISAPFKAVKIPAGVSFTYSVGNGSDSDYYAFSVNSNIPSVLTLTNGWYGNDKYQGAGCKVTNTGSKEAIFNLILLTVADAQSKSASPNVMKLD